MRSLITILVVAAGLGCAGSIRAQCNEPSVPELASYFMSHHQSPEDYVLGKFKDHDVVILGEHHKIRHDPLLVQKLISRLPAEGVFALATEFARAEDQPLIDSLLNSATYDESLARKISFNQFVFWGFQEYVDIFKAAWQVNQSLPISSPRFRILGVNCSPDWSVMKTQEDRENSSIKQRVWNGCTERDWAKVVLNWVGTGQKALVYCGLHHSFTHYLQPIVTDKGDFIRFEDERFGRHIYNRLGKRAFLIALHSPWLQRSYAGEELRPAAGRLDEAIESLGAAFRPLGIDVVNTPLECLTDSASVYARGYSLFRLGTMCDGYIIQSRFSACEVVTPIADFVNEVNLSRAQQQSPNPYFRNAKATEFQKANVQDMASLKKSLSKL